MNKPNQTCVVIEAAGGPEVLKMRLCDIPEPTRHQVLIRVAAAGVNRHDCNQRTRGPGSSQSNIPGLEVAGLVEAVGADVTRVAVGEQVCALVDGGGYAQFAIAHENLVFLVPAGLHLTSAASLPEAAFTTWYNLFCVAQLQPSETVLIHGGTSGVGVFAIQLLSNLGHKVYATCGSEEKCQAALALGATAAINYHREIFDSTMTRRLEQDIDVVLDMSGGAHTAASLDALAYRGRIVHLSSGAKADFNAPLATIMRKEARITGSLLRPLPMQEKIAVAQALRERVWPLIGSAIKPQVAHVFPLTQAPESHACLERSSHVGKIVLQVLEADD
jgi:NADPH:quinone reductase